MEQRLADAVEEKNSYASKFASHQTELEGARRSADEFEEMLRSKLKEVQKEKQTIEDELGDIKLTSK